MSSTTTSLEDTEKSVLSVLTKRFLFNRELAAGAMLLEHCRASHPAVPVTNSNWVVVLGLKPVRDGDQWCFLWGGDLNDGVSAFGDTPLEAMDEFNKAMTEKIHKFEQYEGK